MTVLSSTNFDIDLRDQVPSLLAQVRVNGEWVDIDLPLAEAVRLLESRVEEGANRIRVLSKSVEQLSSQINQSSFATAVRQLATEVDRAEEAISITSDDLTSLRVLYNSRGTAEATAEALRELESRVDENEDGLTAASKERTQLSSRIEGEETARADADRLLQTSVNQNDEAIKVNASAITALRSAVGERALATALDALVTRVTTNGEDITALSERVTALSSSITTDLGTKADAAALDALRTEVRANDGDITALGERITTLDASIQTDLGRKADSSALDSLRTEVRGNDGDIRTLSQSIVDLGTRLDGEVTARGMAITDLSTRIEAVDDRVDVVSREITQVRAEIEDGESVIVDRLTFYVTTGQLQQMVDRLRAGRAFEAGRNASSLNDFEIQTVRRSGRRFTIDISPGNADWPNPGSITLRPAGWVGALPIMATRVTLGATAVNSDGEWFVQGGIRIPRLAQAEQLLEARITNAENLEGNTELANLARWQVKTRVGDLQGGVGLVTDGANVRFVIETGTLRVNPDGSTTLTDAKQPFVVENGIVYINAALIRDASITNAMIENLDAGKITTGELSADRISAAYAEALELNADQITAGTIAADRISGDLRNAQQIYLDASVEGTRLAGNSPGTTFTIAQAISGFDQVLLCGLGRDRSGFGSASRYVEPRLVPALGASGYHRINVLGSRNSADDVDVYAQSTGTSLRLYSPNQNFRLIRVIGFNAPGVSGLNPVTPQRSWLRQRTFYRRGTSSPSRPSGGSYGSYSFLSGWSTSALTPTATQNVYQVTLTQGGIGSSTPTAETWSANIWSSVIIFRNRTGQQSWTRGPRTFYARAAAPPSTPTFTAYGNWTVTLGWLRTNPGATATQDVYSVTLTQFGSGSSTPTSGTHTGNLWSSPVLVERRTGSTSNSRTRTFYRRASSAPSRPTSSAFGAYSGVTGWQTTNPGASATQDVYSVVLTQNFNSQTISSSTHTGNSWGSVSLVERRTGTATRTISIGAVTEATSGLNVVLTGLEAGDEFEISTITPDGTTSWFSRMWGASDRTEFWSSVALGNSEPGDRITLRVRYPRGSGGTVVSRTITYPGAAGAFPTITSVTLWKDAISIPEILRGIITMNTRGINGASQRSLWRAEFQYSINSTFSSSDPSNNVIFTTDNYTSYRSSSDSALDDYNYVRGRIIRISDGAQGPWFTGNIRSR